MKTYSVSYQKTLLKRKALRNLINKYYTLLSETKQKAIQTGDDFDAREMRWYFENPLHNTDLKCLDTILNYIARAHDYETQENIREELSKII